VQVTEKVFQQQKATQSYAFLLEMVVMLQVSLMDSSFIWNECSFGDVINSD